jgi:YHS domain-containing protein
MPELHAFSTGGISMSDTANLAARIDAEFTAFDERLKRNQEERIREFRERQERLAALEPRLEKLSELWRPRLEALAERFGDRVQVTPKVERSRREASFNVQSDLAVIRLRFSVAPDGDARKLIFGYELSIIPVFTEFESHGELEFPIDAVDEAALGRWLDDRILAFVRVYLSLQENQYYLKDHMVTDPIARVSFPKHVAGATLELRGKTYYFIGEETRREFEQKQAAGG